MNEKILIVDDEKSIRDVCVQIFKLKNYDVDAVSSVSGALSEIRKKEYDLIMTDLHLAGNSGENLIKKVHKNFPQTGVIVMTAYADMNSVVNCLRLGASDYVPKPFEMNDLLRAAENFFETRRLKKQVIRLKEISALKTQFLSNVSHELRNPLTAIKGASDLYLKIEKNGSDRKKLMQIVKNNTARMLVLVEDLLRAAETETKQIKLEKNREDICVCAAHAVTVVKTKADVKNIKVSLKKGPPVFVFCDGVRIEQVVINLLDNAIKFSPEGSAVEIQVTSGKGKAKISVLDSGPGVIPEDLSKVFDRFYQSGTTLAHKSKGFGLGLSIVKQLVELHGGTISAKSHTGGKKHGAEFTVLLPLPEKNAKTGERAV
ncbi:MAG: ATP-binding protein [Elusimicrobiota bacterium]|nr:ATP-binding protein [Elusimicrobiota bacterium]